MNQILDAILNAIGGGIGSVVRVIQRAISLFWGVFVALGQLALNAQNYVYTQWLSFWGELRSFGNNIYTVLRWIRDVWIPRIAARVRDEAIGWATQLARDARNFVFSIVSTLERWARQALTSLENWARAAVRWLTDRVGELRHNLAVVARRVAALLSDPTVLATWLIDALWRVAVVHIEQRAVTIGRWILAKAVSAALFSASLVESVIVRIL